MFGKDDKNCITNVCLKMHIALTAVFTVHINKNMEGTCGRFLRGPR